MQGEMEDTNFILSEEERTKIINEINKFYAFKYNCVRRILLFGFAYNLTVASLADIEYKITTQKENELTDSQKKIIKDILYSKVGYVNKAALMLVFVIVWILVMLIVWINNMI